MAAPKTVLTYPLNGALKDFDIPFEYLARKFVVITLVGATRRVLVLNADYRFATRKLISTTTAWGPAQGFDLIEIRRVTSATDRLVDFSDGSILRAYDLNTAQVQSLHIAEEARDLTADTIGVNNSGNLDARGRRIVNLGDAIDPGDAVTLRQEQAWGASALNSANASANSATASQTSRLASESARDAALASKNAAAQSEANAMKWSANAEDSVVSGGLYSSYHYSRKAAAQAVLATSNGAAQVALATTQAGNAQTSANASEVSNLSSKDWATKTEDVVVSGGLYSSYHYSRKAAASATAAKTSETNSKTSEINAAGWAAGLNIPTATGNGGKMLAQKTNESGLEYKDLAQLLTDPWALQPIGVHIPLEFGAPLPPTNQSYRYVALDNDATYNGSVLTSISVTGADPLIVATAVINLAGSPMNGNTIRLSNEERRFLRAGKAVKLDDSANLAHNHAVTDPGHAHGTPVGLGTAYTAGGVYGPTSGGGGTYGSTTGISIQNNGATEARPRNMAVRYFMRIK